MSVRLTVLKELQEVAKEQNVVLPPPSDSLVLLDSGLDSLGFAIKKTPFYRYLPTRLEVQLS